MTPSKRTNGHAPTESTPLLPPTSSTTAVNQSQVLAAEETSILAPEPNDARGHAEPLHISRFQDNGLLEGISRTRFWFIFGGIVCNYFVAMFDSTLMASSHPVITSYFNASNSASWLSTAFLLTSTSLQPLFGRMSDTVGRRPLYLFGLVLLSATTAWCALAQSIGSFIAARAFCGFGAAGVLAMGGIMTNDMVSIDVRGTYQAYLNLLYGSGQACGAAFGGFLCDKIGWRWTFGIQIPVLVVLLISAVFSTPRDLGPQLAKTSGQSIWDALKGFDIAGSVLLTGSVAFLILGLNLGGNVFPWKHPLVITSLVVAAIAATLFLRVELKANRPVMPLSFLTSKPRGNLIFNNCFAQIGINTIFFNAPLYFQAVKLESASVSGFRLAGPSICLTACAMFSGFMITATGRMKWLIVTGSACMLMGAVCLAAMWESTPKWIATIFLIPAGVGQGLSFPATTLAALATSTQEDQAVITSTLTLWRSLGVVMGVSFSSLILQNALTAYLNRFVTGKHKGEIILRVRQSVRAIHDLDPTHRSQVIDAYARSLRVTFILAIAAFVLVNAVVFTIDLPNLRRKKEAESNGSSDTSRSAP